MKRSKCLFICTLLLAMVAGHGAFAGEGAEPEKKTPGMYFVSPHVDPTMEFDVQEVEIKGVKLMIPVLKGCTLESTVTGEGRNELCYISILESTSPIMLLFIAIDNMHKDDGALYEVFRAIMYKRYLDGLLSRYNGETLESFGFTYDKTGDSIFESNYPSAFLFRTDLFLQPDDGNLNAGEINSVVAISDIAVYTKGFFIAIIGMDFGLESGDARLMTTWLNRFVQLNK